MLPIEPKNRGRGRRPEQNRAIINGIFWRLRCGAPWRDVPTKYGNWNTVIVGSGGGAKPESGRPWR
ncbi:transposase [Agrobacterium sp. S7/73]|uniref:transposase n=1 Tax=Agrobacterium sp. S7/73 TaxID=2820002 RepID=UPI001E307223|nr:transposase [Agrobacterium sp. S7/73]